MIVGKHIQDGILVKTISFKTLLAKSTKIKVYLSFMRIIRWYRSANRKRETFLGAIPKKG